MVCILPMFSCLKSRITNSCNVNSGLFGFDKKLRYTSHKSLCNLGDLWALNNCPQLLHGIVELTLSRWQHPNRVF